MKNNNETVMSLRKKGFQVQVRHCRIPDLNNKELYLPTKSIDFLDSSRIKDLPDEYFDREFKRTTSQKGGKTVVRIDKENIHLNGVAYCSPKDQYNKKEGVKKAICKALQGQNL
tara:strand:+ start:62290 stop:62631 length:342 start_codon:yes stop_codon:yes gene_type:complete